MLVRYMISRMDWEEISKSNSGRMQSRDGIHKRYCDVGVPGRRGPCWTSRGLSFRIWFGCVEQKTTQEVLNKTKFVTFKHKISSEIVSRDVPYWKKLFLKKIDLRVVTDRSKKGKETS